MILRASKFKLLMMMKISRLFRHNFTLEGGGISLSYGGFSYFPFWLRDHCVLLRVSMSLGGFDLFSFRLVESFYGCQYFFRKFYSGKLPLDYLTMESPGERYVV
jgi:hypothetical protein